MGIRKIKLFYGQLVATLHSLPGRWPCAPLHKMASDHVTPSAEPRSIIKFVVEKEVKPANIHRKLNEQLGEKTHHVHMSTIRTISFLRVAKNFSCQLARTREMCFGFRRSDSCLFSTAGVKINTQYYSNFFCKDVHQATLNKIPRTTLVNIRQI
jgi:hypothetical protein